MKNTFISVGALVLAIQFANAAAHPLPAKATNVVLDHDTSLVNAKQADVAADVLSVSKLLGRAHPSAQTQQFASSEDNSLINGEGLQAAPKILHLGGLLGRAPAPLLDGLPIVGGLTSKLGLRAHPNAQQQVVTSTDNSLVNGEGLQAAPKILDLGGLLGRAPAPLLDGLPVVGGVVQNLGLRAHPQAQQQIATSEDNSLINGEGLQAAPKILDLGGLLGRAHPSTSGQQIATSDDSSLVNGQGLNVDGDVLSLSHLLGRDDEAAEERSSIFPDIGCSSSSTPDNADGINANVLSLGGRDLQGRGGAKSCGIGKAASAGGNAPPAAPAKKGGLLPPINANVLSAPSLPFPFKRAHPVTTTSNSQVVTSDESSLVNAKGADVNADILGLSNLLGRDSNVYTSSSHSLVNAKGANVDADVLDLSNLLKRDSNVYTSSSHSLVNAKGAKVDADVLDLSNLLKRDSSVSSQHSSSLVNLKNSKVDANVLSTAGLLGRATGVQHTEDNSLIKTKGAVLDLGIMAIPLGKRQNSQVVTTSENHLVNLEDAVIDADVLGLSNLLGRDQPHKGKKHHHKQTSPAEDGAAMAMNGAAEVGALLSGGIGGAMGGGMMGLRDNSRVSQSSSSSLVNLKGSNIRPNVLSAGRLTKKRAQRITEDSE